VPANEINVVDPKMVTSDDGAAEADVVSQSPDSNKTNGEQGEVDDTGQASLF
jgi:hypothetical protein